MSAWVVPPSIDSYFQNLPLGYPEIRDFLLDLRKIFMNEPNIIKIQKGPCIFIGDTHGDLEASQRVIEKFLEEEITLIFLGDYVDRGKYQLENVVFLFQLKKDYPNKIILLRGNHEEEEMNINYGFRNVLMNRYGKQSDEVFRQFLLTFAQLPLCVLTWNHIFGVHGGIPISLTNKIVSLQEIMQLNRGLTHFEQFDLITAQLLWNDPKEELEGAIPSDRGIGFYFGQDKFEEFIKFNNLQSVIRSHEVFPNGFKYFFNNHLISIFSATTYTYNQKIQAKMVAIDLEETVKLLNIAD